MVNLKYKNNKIIQLKKFNKKQIKNKFKKLKKR